MNQQEIHSRIEKNRFGVRFQKLLKKRTKQILMKKMKNEKRKKLLHDKYW